MHNLSFFDKLKILIAFILTVGIAISIYGDTFVEMKNDLSMISDCKAEFTDNARSESNEIFQSIYINTSSCNSELLICEESSILIDTGSSNDFDVIKNTLLKSNISQLSSIIITKLDNSHMGSASKIINEFNVTNLYLPSYESDSIEYKTMISTAKKKGITIMPMTKGDTIEMGNTALVTVLSTDSDSTVLQANYIDSVFLFMSDASYDTEVKLTEMYDVKSDVLLVSHNGNKDASYNDFIREVAPDYAVISPGTEIYSEEAKKTLEENTDYILTSNEYGRIVISSDGYQLNFSSDKE